MRMNREPEAHPARPRHPRPAGSDDPVEGAAGHLPATGSERPDAAGAAETPDATPGTPRTSTHAGTTTEFTSGTGRPDGLKRMWAASCDLND
jgi:hypothetical protein